MNGISTTLLDEREKSVFFGFLGFDFQILKKEEEEEEVLLTHSTTTTTTTNQRDKGHHTKSNSSLKFI